MAFAAALSTVVFSCKAPQATMVQDNLKNAIPPEYAERQDAVQPNSGLTPWRQFFTDPVLVQLIEAALQNNQDLMIALQDIEIAKSNVLYRNGKLMPTVDIEAGAGVSKAGRYTSEGAGDATTPIRNTQRMPDPLPNFNGGLTADWEVDLWHKLRTEKQSAVAHYVATVDGKNFVLSSLIAEVADNYYELLALDNQLDLIHEYMALQKKALEVSKIQKAAAATTELAVRKFDAELAKSSATEYTLMQQISEKENTINTLLGRYPQPINRNKSAFMNIVPQTVYGGVPSELLGNRPDIKRAEAELQSARLDVEAARKEFYPKLNISAALGLESFSPKYLAKIPESVAYSALGGLAAPLINKTAIQSEFKTADAKQIQALYEYDKTILEAYMEVTNLLSKIKNLDGYFKLKSHQASALDQAIDTANLLFKNSRADYLEVLMNQRDALDAKMELIDAKAMQLQSVVGLYKDLGGGWR